MKTKTRYNKKKKTKKIKKTRRKIGGGRDDDAIITKIVFTKRYLTTQMIELYYLLSQPGSSRYSINFVAILDILKNLAQKGDYQGLMNNFSVEHINYYEDREYLSPDVIHKIRHILTTCYTISKSGNCATASLDTYKHDEDFKQQIMKEPETKEERTKRKDAARDAAVEELRKERAPKIPTLPEKKISSGRPPASGRLVNIGIGSLKADLEAEKAIAAAKYGHSYTSAVVDTSSAPIMPPPLLQPLQARTDWKYSGLKY